MNGRMNKQADSNVESNIQQEYAGWLIAADR